MTSTNADLERQENRRPRYVVLYANIFTQRDWGRFGCPFFEENGYDVLGLECIEVIRAGGRGSMQGNEFFTCPKATVVADCEALKEILLETGPGDIILNLVALSKTSSWLYEFLAQHEIPYVVMTLAGLATVFKGTEAALSVCEGLQWMLLNIRYRAAKLRSSLRDAVSQKRSFPPPRFWLCAGTKLIQGTYFPRSRSTRVLATHSLDVETALFDTHVLPQSVTQPYAVFIDEGVPDHPDFEYLGITAPVTPSRYYRSLNRLFERVESEFKLSVIIAGHPKVNYENENSYDGRPIHKYVTPALVRDCDLVICHNSTAISFGVLFRKPFVFVTTDELERSQLGEFIGRLSSWFGQKRVNIDHLYRRSDPLQLPLMNEQLWRNYEHNFLRSASAPHQSIWKTLRDAACLESGQESKLSR